MGDILSLLDDISPIWFITVDERNDMSLTRVASTTEDYLVLYLKRDMDGTG